MIKTTEIATVSLLCIPNAKQIFTVRAKRFQAEVCAALNVLHVGWKKHGAKDLQRQGEIFLRLDRSVVSTLKIETFLLTFQVMKSEKKKRIRLKKEA